MVIWAILNLIGLLASAEVLGVSNRLTWMQYVDLVAGVANGGCLLAAGIMGLMAISRKDVKAALTAKKTRRR
jgi:hypothetical protein